MPSTRPATLRFGHDGEVGLSARVSTRSVGLSPARSVRRPASSTFSGSAAWPGASLIDCTRGSSAAMRLSTCSWNLSVRTSTAASATVLARFWADTALGPFAVTATRLLWAIGSAFTSFSSERGLRSVRSFSFARRATSIVVTRPAAVVTSRVGSLEAVISPSVASVVLSRGTGVTSSVERASYVLSAVPT
jgi:hypothetical protein